MDLRRMVMGSLKEMAVNPVASSGGRLLDASEERVAASSGWDFGRSREARYALLATIPIPVSKELEEGEKKELTTDPVEMTEFDEFQESEVELKAISTMERFENEELEKQAKLADEPINVQNVTLMEPLASRQAGDVVRALDKLWAQFRAMGIPAFRLHSDRAKELLSSQVEAWATKNHLHQTMTSGDDPQSNGRIESEVCQWKRRLRLTLKSAQVGSRGVAVGWEACQ